MAERFALNQYGRTQLWTREFARKVREDVSTKLGQFLPGGVLAIDAKSIEVFDFSFANELFGKTLLSLPQEYPDRYVMVENLNEYTRENLSKALESMGLAMIERAKGKVRLIGKFHQTDHDTFAAILKGGEPVTANELKDQLEINLNAMNERLAKLTSLSLIRREKVVSSAGREQYQYSVPQ